MMLIDKLKNKVLLEICWNHIYCNKPPELRHKSRGIDDVTLQAFDNNRVTNLDILYERLCKPDFKLAPLKGIAIPKSDGKKFRLLSVPTVEDRIIHKAILVVIAEHIYPIINTGVSHCGVRKNILGEPEDDEVYSIKTALEALTNNVKEQKFNILKADISGFFDNIIKTRLLEKLRQVLPDNSLHSILEQIIFYEFEIDNKTKSKPGISEPSRKLGVSQGSALSPIFSNLYLADFDREMYKLCGKSLIRYADDFVVMTLTKDEIDGYEKTVKSLLEKEGLSLSEKKTNVLNLKKDTLEFLGLKINRHKITITDKKEKNTLANISEGLTSSYYKKLEKVLEKEILEKEIGKQKEEGKSEQEIVITQQQLKKLINIKIIAKLNNKIGGIVQCYKHYSAESFFKKIDTRIAERKKSSSYYTWLRSTSEHTRIEHFIPPNQWQSYFSRDTSNNTCK